MIYKLLVLMKNLQCLFLIFQYLLNFLTKHANNNIVIQNLRLYRRDPSASSYIFSTMSDLLHVLLLALIEIYQKRACNLECKILSRYQEKIEQVTLKAEFNFLEMSFSSAVVPS